MILDTDRGMNHTKDTTTTAISHKGNQSIMENFCNGLVIKS